MRKMILLNPGPVTLSPKVRQAMLREDLCHREPEFSELSRDIRKRLLRIYPQTSANYTAILLTGSGTCAVESMLASLIPKTGKTLVINNGVYGERMANMITAHGKAIREIRSPWTQPMDIKAVEQALRSEPEITHVVAVHHETTTGRLNDMEALGKLCKKYDVELLLDSVSAFGAETIAWEDWNLTACAATANKCLHGAPGISFVIVKKSIFERQSSAARSIYLDLYAYHKAQLKESTPFTQAVHIYYALQQALKELEEAGGQKARQAEYRRRAARIRKGMKALGIEMLLREAVYSASLTSFKLPKGIDYQQLHDHLKQNGFIIYAGQGNLRENMFRIANMGAVNSEDISRLIAAFSNFLSRSS